MPAKGSSLRIDRNQRTLRELTLEKMRDAIIGQYFQPGQRLVERTLCEELGVSRTIVHDTGGSTTVSPSGPTAALGFGCGNTRSGCSAEFRA